MNFEVRLKARRLPGIFESNEFLVLGNVGGKRTPENWEHVEMILATKPKHYD